MSIEKCKSVILILHDKLVGLEIIRNDLFPFS